MAELVMDAAVRLTRDFGGQPQAMLKAREILRGSFDSPKRKRAS